MSRCGKKGGIPKKYHKALKGKYSSSDGNYLAWVAAKWKAETDEKKKDYLKGRGSNKNGACKVKKTKSKQKRKTPPNLPSNAWIKKWGNGTEAQMKAWKAWKEKNKRASRATIGKYLQDQGFPTKSLDCYELRNHGYNCVPGKDGSLGARLSRLVKLRQAAQGGNKAAPTKGPIAAAADAINDVMNGKTDVSPAVPVAPVNTGPFF